MSFDRVTESRRERNRKLLPELGLRYPSDVEIRELAELAGVDDPSIFGQHIRQIILDVHLNDARLRNLSIPKVKGTLRKVRTRALSLKGVLQEIDTDAKGSAHHAGELLENVMEASSIDDRVVLIPECIRLLDLLGDSAFAAQKHATPKRGPKGGGGNPAFDLFVEALFMAAWQRKGNWTNYKSTDQTWTGSLLKALDILQPYVPSGFFPVAELGRSIQHVASKFKKHISKNR